MSDKAHRPSISVQPTTNLHGTSTWTLLLDTRPLRLDPSLLLTARHVYKPPSINTTPRTVRVLLTVARLVPLPSFHVAESTAWRSERVMRTRGDPSPWNHHESVGDRDPVAVHVRVIVVPRFAIMLRAGKSVMTGCAKYSIMYEFD